MRMRFLAGAAVAVLLIAGSLVVLLGLSFSAIGFMAAADQCPLGNDCHDAKMAAAVGLGVAVAGCLAVGGARAISERRRPR